METSAICHKEKTHEKRINTITEWIFLKFVLLVRKNTLKPHKYTNGKGILRGTKMEVKIYMCISYKGMQKKGNRYGACIVYVTKKGKVEERYYYNTCGSSVGYNQVMLMALVEAMKNLTKPCYITAYVKTEYIENMLNRGLPGQWEKKGWKNAKGEPVACAKEWSELLQMLNIHNLTFSKAYDNEYTKEMDRHIKELRRESDNDDISSSKL